MTIGGDIRLDGARRTVTVVRDLGAAPDEVWDAIVDQERAARWIGAVSRDHDRYALTMPDEPTVTGRIVACQPPSRLSLTWRYGTEPETRVEVGLTPTDTGTRLTITHRRMPAILASGYGAGWEGLLTDLAEALADGPGSGIGADPLLHEYRVLEASLVPGTITRDGERSAIRLERLLDAPPERVWDALTTPRGLAGWLWPIAVWPDDPVRKRPLRLGDAFAFDDANQPGDPQLSRVLELVPDRSVTISWGTEGVPVRFSIEPVGGATRLTLEQDPAADAFAAGRMRSGADYAAGWHTLVDGLTLSLLGQSVPDPAGLWDAAYAVYARS